MKLLIADDDRVIHLTFTKPLIKRGYEVLNAYDGQEALEMVDEHQPDIIILDLTMPKMDGRDVCENLKKSPKNKHIKVIMFTGKREAPYSRRLGFELGADEYVTKPCSILYLERVINKLKEKID